MEWLSRRPRVEVGPDARPDPRFGQPRTVFFGIGAQKAATTWVDAYLREHPEICLPVHKELHYWNAIRLPGAGERRARVKRELDRIDGRPLRRRLLRGSRGRTRDRAWRLIDAMLRDQSGGHRAYADVLFQTWRGEPVVGEITPAYALLGAEAFAEMAGLAPDVRFVFIMRDPVGRLISGARMNERRARRALEPAPEPLSVEERVGRAASDPSEPNLLRSRYDLTIRRLEDAVAKEKIGYFFYETLFRQEEVDRLTDFLGVARRPAPLATRTHAAAGPAKPINPAVERRALAVLAPTYAFVRERFGSLVPADWRDPAALEPGRAACR